MQFSITKSIFFIFLGCIVLSSCKDEESDDYELPACFTELYDLFTDEFDDCPETKIIVYEFDGREVIAFEQGICISDAGINVYETDCEEICFLGGIAGIFECDGINFSENAVLKNIIWER